MSPKTVKTAWIVSALVVVAVAVLVPTVGRVQPVSGKAHFVRGTVEVSLISPQIGAASQKLKDIALPNANVFLVRLNATNVPLASATTDLSGRFIIKTHQSGIFTLCVEAEGFKRFCATKEFRFAQPTFSYGILHLPMPSGSDTEAVAYGKLTLQDGKLARGFEPFMDVNAYPRVDLSTPSGAKHRAYVNNFGEYIVPQIPVKEDFTLRASIDKLASERQIKALTKLTGGRAYPFDFVLPNVTPRIRVVSAMSSGRPVQIATPGSNITLHAVADHPKGHKLEYRWLLPDGQVLGPTNDSELQWRVPSQRASLGVSVLVSDQNGGYARSGIALTASTTGAPFSGVVVDTFGQPVAGALVDVNGRLINASTQGRFSFNVPIADRYVMTIRSAGVENANQRGFGTASFIYKAPIRGGRWVMRRAQVMTVDPTQPIVLQHRRDERDCVGLSSSKVDWKPYLHADIFQWQDGRGNIVALPDLGARDPKVVQHAMRLVSRISSALVGPLAEATKVRGQFNEGRLPCTPGIKVEIPANALIDPSTNRAPSGPVQVALSTVDLTAPNQMPGDYSADDGSGKTFGMESFGAGSIEIGAGASRYQLKSGENATVTIPVDVTQLAGGAHLEPKIPFLYYNEQKGIWQQDGEALLTGSGASSAYVKKVTHFSTMNADILKSGQSCVAVELDPAANFTLPLDVEVVLQPSVPNPNVTQVRHLLVDSTKSNVIYNLPNNSDIVLTPIIPGTQADGSSGNVPAGVFVVNTGGPQTAAVAPPPANPDGTYYAESGGQPTGPCASRVVLSKLGPVTIANGLEYLQGLFFQSTNIDEFNATIATEIDNGVKDYYNNVDPRKLRNSLNLFKQKNRFGQPLGPNEAEYDAQYANSGDLGFGRDMHCRRNASNNPPGSFDYACYVTNYGQPPANNPDQQDANDVLDPNKQPDATVAMEFSRVENPLGDPIEFPDDDRAVKFYVYDTKNPDSEPLRKADLDGHGARPVPQLCMVCHGGIAASVPADVNNPAGPKKGAFANRNDIISMGSNFIPFDMHLFNYPAAKSKASQQAAFKNLNVNIVRGVANATGTGEAIVEAIDTAFYPGNSPTQIEDQVIPGWDPGNVNSNRHRFYRDVFARACRTCHASHPFGAPSFSNANDFEAEISAVQNFVCSKRVMPHAQRTNNIFWTSLNPNMAAFLELYGQTLPGWSTLESAQCGQSFQGGGTAPSVFASQIYPIMFNNCTGCHSAVGLANYSVGNVADTYNSIITAMTKDGTTKYIIGHDPGNSRIYQRITTGGPGVRMPQNGANLVVTDTDNPPDGVFDASEFLGWINSGAPGP
jgi:cytochrome c5